MKRLGFRPQRTLARSVSVSGVGLLFGHRVRVRFRPAPPDTGLVFVRTDLRQPLRLAARYAHVTGTHRATVLWPFLRHKSAAKGPRTADTHARQQAEYRELPNRGCQGPSKRKN